MTEPAKPAAPFPSGPWRGFYLARGKRGEMDLQLSFGDGRIRGTGRDPIGEFRVHGRYDQDLVCQWVKTYADQHDVHYRGFGESGVIWGTWEIRDPGTVFQRGGFRIWPKGSGEAVDLKSATAVEQPVAVGGPTPV